MMEPSGQAVLPRRCCVWKLMLSGERTVRWGLLIAARPAGEGYSYINAALRYRVEQESNYKQEAPSCYKKA